MHEIIQNCLDPNIVQNGTDPHHFGTDPIKCRTPPPPLSLQSKYIHAMHVMNWCLINRY